MRMRLLVISAPASCDYYTHLLRYCRYYLLSAYEGIGVLNYYLNLYARLNNAVINILYASLNKLRFHLLYNLRLSTIEGHCLIY